MIYLLTGETKRITAFQSRDIYVYADFEQELCMYSQTWNVRPDPTKKTSGSVDSGMVTVWVGKTTVYPLEEHELHVRILFEEWETLTGEERETLTGYVITKILYVPYSVPVLVDEYRIEAEFYPAKSEEEEDEQSANQRLLPTDFAEELLGVVKDSVFWAILQRPQQFIPCRFPGDISHE